MGVLGCPLTPRPTEGGIGGAHGPWEKICGSMGVFLDPGTNSWRYRGCPRVPGAIQWEYWGVL